MTAQYLPFLLLIPLLICIVTRRLFPKTVTLKEMVIQFVAGGIFIAITFWLTVYLSTSGHYFVNGEVTGKERVKTSCSHSYQICVGTGEQRICTTHYHHPYDFEYRVDTTVGSLYVPTIDSQGKNTPPRFEQVVIGEHAADTRSFRDYLKSNSRTLHKRNIQDIKPVSQGKPNIYDLYRLNNFVSDIPINTSIANVINNHAKKHIGSRNIIYYFSSVPESIRYDVMSQWYIGLNDIVVMLGIQGNKVIWTDALTYADNFKNGGLGSHLSYYTNGEELSVLLISKIEHVLSEKYYRPTDKELKYLSVNTEISTSKWIFLMILNFIFNALLGYYMHRNDV